MQSAARHRLSVVTRPLDVTLGTLRWVLIPVLAGVAAAAALRLFEPLAGVENRGLVVTASVALIVGIGLLQIPAAASRLDDAMCGLRRRAVLPCGHEPGTCARRLRCRLAPSYMRGPFFAYDDQREAVDSLLGACRSADAPGFWFIEGASGCGKTRTALLLVSALVRDPGLYGLTGRLFLYDLALGRETCDALLRHIGSHRHANAVVFVDNFQLVPPDVIRQLTGRLVDAPGRSPERMIVFLSRPIEGWALSPGTDVRLMSIAKTEARHRRLSGPRKDPISSAIRAIDPQAAELIDQLGASEQATAPQLHLAQIIAHRRRTPAVITSTLHLLDGTAMGIKHSATLLRALAILSGLAMHRGAFSRSDLRRAIRSTRVGNTLIARQGDAARVRRVIRALGRAGFVQRVWVGSTRFVLHEAMAALLIDRLTAFGPFATTLRDVGRVRLDRSRNVEPASTQWLVAAEIGEQARMVTTFDAALLDGAFTEMTACLLRCERRYALSPEVQLQEALLLDRTGDFAGSRAQYDVARASGGVASEHEFRILTGQLEASHTDALVTAVAHFVGDPDPFVSAVAEYWTRHVDAHTGSFSPAELTSLAATASNALTGRQPTYWERYELARMHFDALRHHYLTGLATSGVLTASRSSSAIPIVSELPTYEALQTLYVKAHFLGHVLVPQVAILHEAVTPEQAAVAGVGSSDTCDLLRLIAATKRMYQRARDEFWQYGDRESRYLQADVINASMFAGDVGEQVELDLREYERFIDGTGFRDLASLPQLYLSRMHAMRYCQQLAAGQEGPRLDDELAAARRCIEHARELDAGGSNRFGVLRADLYSVLVDALEMPLDGDRLHELARDASAGGFRIEGRLVQELSTGKVTHARLYAMLRFAPFVHQ